MIIVIYIIIKIMWSIRMRASKTDKNIKDKEIHISGAEGLFEKKEILKMIKKYIERALKHPKGRSDKIVLTIEKIKERPKRISPLPVSTIPCDTPEMAQKIIYQRLSEIGVSKRAINNAFKILTSEKTMRGASLINVRTGKRLEPDKERGVRVSRLGIEKTLEKTLIKSFSKMKVPTTTVKEALILASKVASHPSVVAEICISDDPDYTTGYIASKELGYLRITNIKRYNERHGGRVFIIKENSDIKKIIQFLEKKPIIISIT